MPLRASTVNVINMYGVIFGVNIRHGTYWVIGFTLDIEGNLVRGGFA